MTSANIISEIWASTSPNSGETPEQFARRLDRLLSEHPSAINEGGEDGYTPLHSAAAFNVVPAVERLLAHGANVNAVEKKRGQTPLHNAAFTGNGTIPDMLATMTLLLDKGANPNARDHKGKTPLFGISSRQEERALAIYRLLVAHGADSEVINYAGENLIFYVSEFLDTGVDLMHEIISRVKNTPLPVFVNAINNGGVTPLLQCTARASSVKFIRELVQAGANPCAVDKNGATTLHYACKHHINRAGILKYLLKRCPLLRDAQDIEGRTALHIAVGTHFIEGVTVLLQAGANPLLRDNENKTPRERAMENWYIGTNSYYAPWPYGEATSLRSFNPAKAAILRRLDACKKK